MHAWYKKIYDSVILMFQFFKVSLQIVYGAWKISKLQQPVVSIFGGHLLQKKEHPYIQQAHQVAVLLVKNNISVLTGGGPGIMEAASFGVAQAKTNGIRSMGIGVVGLKGEEGLNPYVQEGVILDYFFARKYLMINYAMGFIVFPGGVGTLDELCELLNLIQTEKREHAPVILVNVQFWAPFMALLKQANQQGLLLSTGALECITVTDDIQEAVHIFVEHCKKCTKTGKKYR